MRRPGHLAWAAAMLWNCGGGAVDSGGGSGAGGSSSIFAHAGITGGSGGRATDGNGLGGTAGGAAPGSGGQPSGGGPSGEAGSAGLGMGSGAAGGGATGGGVTGGAPGGTARECNQVSDCQLSADCCRCASVPKDELQPFCTLACIQDACQAMSIADNGLLACSSGRCTFARTCDQNQVRCRLAAPQCSTGSVPEVVNNCYSGLCLPIEECHTITSCEACADAGMLCVEQKVLPGVPGGRESSFVQCIPPSERCNPPSCECLGVCDPSAACSQQASSVFSCILAAPSAPPTGQAN